MNVRIGFGQDSHRFLPKGSTKPLILAGVEIPNFPGFDANSDGDVIFHAVTNAISSLTGKPVLGLMADELFKKGIVDSQVYLEHALKDLPPGQIKHLSLSLELKEPKVLPYFESFKQNLSRILGIKKNCVGITAHSGEDLTAFGKGVGAQAHAILTWEDEKEEKHQ